MIIQVGHSNGILCQCIEYEEQVDGGKWRIWVKGGIAYSVDTKGTEAKPPSTGWMHGTSPMPQLRWLDQEEGYDKHFFMC